MKTNEEQTVRDVLASMIAEAPPPTDYENLNQLQVVRTIDHPHRSPLVATLAGFVIALAVIGGVVAVAQRPASVSISRGAEPTQRSSWCRLSCRTT